MLYVLCVLGGVIAGLLIGFLMKSYIDNIEFEKMILEVEKASRGEYPKDDRKSREGKTTLIKMLGGILKPDEGKVFIEGVDISSLSDTERTIIRRRRVGMIFQSSNLLPELNIYQNILLPLKLDKRKNIDKEYVDMLIDSLNLSDILNNYPEQVSGGQGQKASIARALINKPAVILADEPTGNLDRISGTEVLEVLYNMRRRLNQTLIMVTHDQMIADVADNIIRISDGCIIGNTDFDV